MVRLDKTPLFYTFYSKDLTKMTWPSSPSVSQRPVVQHIHNSSANNDLLKSRHSLFCSFFRLDFTVAPIKDQTVPLATHFPLDVHYPTTSHGQPTRHHKAPPDVQLRRAHNPTASLQLTLLLRRRHQDHLP